MHRWWTSGAHGSGGSLAHRPSSDAWTAYGGDIISIMRGRAHGQEGQGPPDSGQPPGSSRTVQSPRYTARRAHRHGQHTQRISVCFTSLLDHLDTKSLQQRDMSLLYLGMSIANQFL